MNHKSEKGEMPEINPNEFDLITSIVHTYESNDLHTRTNMNFRYDERNECVYLDIQCMHNGRIFDIPVFGFKKEKVEQMCENIKDYFSKKDNKPTR